MAALGRSVVLAAVRHEAEQLRAESALVRRRLEALAAVERALEAVTDDAAVGILDAWMESPAAAGGRTGAASGGRAPFDRFLPADHAALADESLVALVVRMFARYAEASAVDLGVVDLAEAAPRLSPVEAARLQDGPGLTLVAAPDEGVEPPEETGPRRRARRGMVSATVYGFLATLPYALRPSEIARRLNLKLENVCAALVVLEHRGLIDKHEGKFYALAPAAPVSAPLASAPAAGSTHPHIVRDGDHEFEVVNPPRASAYLGSSIGSRAIGE